MNLRKIKAGTGKQKVDIKPTCGHIKMNMNRNDIEARVIDIPFEQRTANHITKYIIKPIQRNEI